MLCYARAVKAMLCVRGINYAIRARYRLCYAMRARYKLRYVMREWYKLCYMRARAISYACACGLNSYAMLYCARGISYAMRAQ